MHLDLAAGADNQAHDLGTAAAERHEIDKSHGAVAGLELRFEDKRIRPIAPRDAGRLARRDKPAAMIVRSKQRGKARLGIKARPAQPVDRAVARHQRGAPAIADQRVIFDA